MPGTLFVVATPIGNLEDITLRALRVLREATLIAAEDTRAGRFLLEHHGVTVPRIVSFFDGNEAARTAELVGELLRGANVALISEAGMPGISDPGQRLCAAAAAAGVRVEVIPGPSAVVTALVASGLPTDRFLFLGFPPREDGARRELCGQLTGERATLVFYESPVRVAATLADLAASLGGERAACVARELTKLHEEIVRGSLAELAARYAEVAPRGECTLVIAGASLAEVEAARGIDLESEVRALIAAGMSPKDVAARVALKTGKPRRQIYQLALSIHRNAVESLSEDDESA